MFGVKFLKFSRKYFWKESVNLEEEKNFLRREFENFENKITENEFNNSNQQVEKR